MKGRSFRGGGEIIRKSGMVFGAWLVSFLILVIGATYFLEDYMTSVKGYELWPSQHYFPWIIWIGAATPQAGQWFFAYLALDDQSRYWAWGATGVLMFVDSTIDLLFKAQAAPVWTSTIMWASVAEIVVMYTICSEVFLALGMGLCIELYPDMVNALRELRGRLHRGNQGAFGFTNRSHRGEPMGPGHRADDRPRTRGDRERARPAPRGDREHVR